MAKLTEYPQALTFDANDILIKDGTNGTKKITVEDAAKYFSQYTNKNIASGFSAQTSYTKGAYVLKDGVLYRFTENHPAGPWSTSDTTEIKLTSDMSALAALLDETNAAVVSVEGDVASILGIIAPYVSATMTAPSNITSGEYVLANGVLYRATANIASGSTLTPNGNVVAVTVGEELTKVIASDAQKADADGTSPNLTAGNALQLVSTVGIEDQVPYNFRTSGGTADIGDREEDMIVGGTIAWNQLAQKGLYTALGTTVTYDSATGIATVTPTAYDNNAKGVYRVTAGGKTFVGHKYLCAVELKPDNDGDFNIGFVPVFSSGTIPADQWTRCEGIISYSSSSFVIYLKALASGWESGSFQYRNVQCFDLTKMFGSTIADYIYSLEQANAGDGVAWFKKLFPKEYYAYDAGTLQSVQTSAHKMVGFNAWDEEWESGTIQSANGQNAPDTNRIRSKNYIPVVPNQPYYLKAPQYAIIYQYDSDKNFLGTTGSRGDNRISVFDSPTSYVRFAVGSSSNPVTTYDNDICLNLSWDGEKDGTYESYVEYNYPLDSSLELRGIPELDENNRLYYDGDTYESDGTVTRKFGIIDLGSLTWTKSTNEFRSNTVPEGIKAPVSQTSIAKAICSRYKVIASNYHGGEGVHQQNTGVSVNTSGYIWAYDSDLWSGTASEFKTAMSGIYLVYLLETPTTETAEAYTNPQIVDDFGTEEYVDAGVEAGTRDVAVPVGHQTFYQANLRAKLEMSPDSPDGDGDYIVRQANGENTYVPLVIPNELPAAPSTDGTYVLHATVADGVLTYSWVADT